VKSNKKIQGVQYLQAIGEIIRMNTMEQELCANFMSRRDFLFKPDSDDFPIVRLRNYFVSSGDDSCSRPTAFHDEDSRNSLPFCVSVARAASAAGTLVFDAADLVFAL